MCIVEHPSFIYDPSSITSRFINLWTPSHTRLIILQSNACDLNVSFCRPGKKASDVGLLVCFLLYIGKFFVRIIGM